MTIKGCRVVEFSELFVSF